MVLQQAIRIHGFKHPIMMNNRMLSHHVPKEPGALFVWTSGLGVKRARPSMCNILLFAVAQSSVQAWVTQHVLEVRRRCLETELTRPSLPAGPLRHRLNRTRLWKVMADEVRSETQTSKGRLVSLRFPENVGMMLLELIRASNA